MKRWMAWILAVMCLFGMAYAEKTEAEFQFRNAVTWNMAQKEVLAAEEELEDGEYYETEELSEGIEVAMFSYVTMSKFEADLSYVFIEDSLQMCLYELSLDEEEVEYLSGALAAKYGQQPVETNEFMYEVMCRLVPDIYADENPFGNGLCWHLLDGTVVQLVPMKDSEDYGLAYMNYEAMIELLDDLGAGGYNLFGL